jgi:hypothetical protein
MENQNIKKVGVGWKREFKNKKVGLKLSINGKLYVAYENTKKVKPTDVDFVIVEFLEPIKKAENS